MFKKTLPTLHKAPTLLKDIQNHFQEYLTENDQSKERIFAADVFNDEKVGNITRMQVYFEGYRLRLYEVLMQDFPKLVRLMGEDSFRRAFILYLNQYPSHHFSARYFGQHFVKFLAYHDQDTPWFVEMALFEWLIGETLDAADAKPLPTNYLMTLKPEAWGLCQFKLHPSFRHHTFKYNIPEIWLAIENSNALMPIQGSSTPQTWLFWRKGLQSLFESSNFEQNLVLSGILQEMDFATICESCIPFVPETQIPAFTAQTIQKYIENELLV